MRIGAAAMCICSPVHMMQKWGPGNQFRKKIRMKERGGGGGH